jgi:hypothetical protein
MDILCAYSLAWCCDCYNALQVLGGMRALQSVPAQALIGYVNLMILFTDTEIAVVKYILV